jgi:EF-hand domain
MSSESEVKEWESNPDFDRKWLDGGSNVDSDKDVCPDIAAIRDYAYAAFDRLDRNGNGFIERSELYAALSDQSVDAREKSFISFLLNNQEAISEMVQEEESGPRLGLSRGDLESYFALISRLLA